MPQPEAAARLYRQVQRLQLVIVAAGRRAWSGMRADFDPSWEQVAPGLVSVVTAGQLAAARTAAEYVPAVLDEVSSTVEPDARVRPQSFAGVAADGRSLPGLLYGAVARSKAASRGNVTPTRALRVGGDWLDAIVQTVITDAVRQVTQAEVATREGVGWVRAVNPPCCGRCAILAGRWYRYNAGFQRHPRCDCFAIPAAEDVAGSLMTSPQALFEQGQVKGLTRRERDRLDNGDDLNKVINESRDMWRARIQEQKRADKNGTADAAADPVTRDRQARLGLEDLFASTRSRTEAVAAMRANGYAD